MADRSLVRPRQQAKHSRHRWAKRARRRPCASCHGTGGSAAESAAATRASHSSRHAWVQSSPDPSSTLASSLEASSSRTSGGSASAASNSLSGAIWDTRSVGARPPHGHGQSLRGERDAAGATKRGNPEATTSRFLLAIPLTRPGRVLVNIRGCDGCVHSDVRGCELAPYGAVLEAGTARARVEGQPVRSMLLASASGVRLERAREQSAGRARRDR